MVVCVGAQNCSEACAKGGRTHGPLHGPYVAHMPWPFGTPLPFLHLRQFRPKPPASKAHCKHAPPTACARGAGVSQGVKACVERQRGLWRRCVRAAAGEDSTLGHWYAQCVCVWGGGQGGRRAANTEGASVVGGGGAT